MNWYHGMRLCFIAPNHDLQIVSCHYNYEPCLDSFDPCDLFLHVVFLQGPCHALNGLAKMGLCWLERFPQ